MIRAPRPPPRSGTGQASWQRVTLAEPHGRPGSRLPGSIGCHAGGALHHAPHLALRRMAHLH